MKYINIVFLLLTSNMIVAMEAERKSLASIFDIDTFCHNKDIVQDINSHCLSDTQWWYVGKEIQYDHQPCHLKAGKGLTAKKNGFAYVHFNKTGTEIVALPMHGLCCFACVWDRESGKELERVDYDAHHELLLSSYGQTWANRLYASTRAPRELNKNERLWCGEYSLCDGLEAVLVTIKRDYSHGRLTNRYESKACVWDRIQGKETLQLVHDGPVNMAHFNKSSVEIVTASDDCTMRLWHAITGKELLRIMYDVCVQSAWFNEVGTEIVVATDDGKIQILAKYDKHNVSQILLKRLLYLWLQLAKPSKEINSSEKLLDAVALLLWCDRKELGKAWESFPEHMQTAIWLSMHKKIKKYGR